MRDKIVATGRSFKEIHLSENWRFTMVLSGMVRPSCLAVTQTAGTCIFATSIIRNAS